MGSGTSETSVIAFSVWFSTNSIIFGVERVGSTVAVDVVVVGLSVGSSSSSIVLPVNVT